MLPLTAAAPPSMFNLAELSMASDKSKKWSIEEAIDFMSTPNFSDIAVILVIPSTPSLKEYLLANDKLSATFLLKVAAFKPLFAAVA